MLMHNNICVGAVIRDAAKKKVADYFRYKMKNTVDVHPKLNYEKSHTTTGKLVGHGIRTDLKKTATTGKYVYNDKKILILKNKEYMLKMKIVLENDYMIMLKNI